MTMKYISQLVMCVCVWTINFNFKNKLRTLRLLFNKSTTLRPNCVIKYIGDVPLELQTNKKSVLDINILI